MQGNFSVKQEDKKRKIYLVLGRMDESVKAIQIYLEKMGLTILQKEGSREIPSGGTPFIGNELDAAFKEAQAIVVLFTGDEEARLCETFYRRDDDEFEKIFSPQPTQEQIFEAGYAFGVSPKRTILIQIGDVRPFSDIIGRHMLHFAGTDEDYNLLQARLKLAGCLIDTDLFSTATEPEEVPSLPNSRNVFVVHGRNVAAKSAMFRFLRTLQLKPIEWNWAVRLTRMGAPYTGEAVDVGIEDARAVVVLLTGDDIIRLPRAGMAGFFSHVAQARPNVLFEAGIAFSKRRDQTILVQLGKVRPCGDMNGRSLVKLTNKTSSRWNLAQRLHTAGCPVDFHGSWQSSGDFEVPLCSEV